MIDKSWIELKLAALEEGELEADRLDDVPAKSEDKGGYDLGDIVARALFLAANVPVVASAFAVTGLALRGLRIGVGLFALALVLALALGLIFASLIVPFAMP